jgi:hypothetical protein
MPPDENAIHLTLQVSSTADTDADTLDRQTRQLRDAIRELDVESASLRRGGTPPTGAKAGEGSVVGEIVVQILPSLISAVLPKVIECVQAWFTHGRRTEKIKIQVGGQSVELEYAPGRFSQANVQALVRTLAGSSPEPTAER